MQAQLAAALQGVRDVQTGQIPAQPGNTATVFSIPAVAIAAGGSVSGQVVSAMIGGSLTTVNASADVYNQMPGPTVATAGWTIIVGANGDGSFTAISQGCTA